MVSVYEDASSIVKQSPMYCSFDTTGEFDAEVLQSITCPQQLLKAT